MDTNRIIDEKEVNFIKEELYKYPPSILKKEMESLEVSIGGFSNKSIGYIITLIGIAATLLTRSELDNTITMLKVMNMTRVKGKK